MIFQDAFAQIQKQLVQTSIPDDKSPSVAYLTDGRFSDAGWGAFAYNAGQEIISKYGYEVSFLDNVSISNIETTLKSYADRNYDIIIAQGYEWGDPVMNNFTGTIFTPGLESTKNSTTEDGIIYIAPFYGFQNKIPKDVQAKFIQLSQDIRNKKTLFQND